MRLPTFQAALLVPENKRVLAVAIVFSRIALANVTGVPLAAAEPALQISVANLARAVPNLVSTFDISAFDGGILWAACVGGFIIANGFGLCAVPIAAALLSPSAVSFMLILHQSLPTTTSPGNAFSLPKQEN